MVTTSATIGAPAGGDGRPGDGQERRHGGEQAEIAEQGEDDLAVRVRGDQVKGGSGVRTVGVEQPPDGDAGRRDQDDDRHQVPPPIGHTSFSFIDAHPREQ